MRGLRLLAFRGALVVQASRTRATMAAVPSPGPGVARGPVVILAGPTGVGKSKTSLELAKLLGGEVVSADSVQVHVGLDVGSDKLPVAERRGVPHHLLDILPPEAEFSVGDFYDAACSAADGILGRGAVPLVVGGNGFYLRWLVNGKPDVPRSDADAWAAADAAIAQATAGAADVDDKWRRAVAALAAAGDPDTASKLASNDYYRLHRALQVLHAAGRPIGSFPTGGKLAGIAGGGGQHADAATPPDPPPHGVTAAAPSSRAGVEAPVGNAGLSTTPPPLPPYDYRCFFLVAPRAQLFRQIDARCESMVVGGLLHEAAQLLRAGVLPGSCTASRAIGYRQALDFLAARRAAGGSCCRDDVLSFVAEFQAASRSYATRQLTWFRGEPRYLWVPVEGRTPAEVAFEIAGRVAGGPHTGGGRELGLLTRAERDTSRRYITKLEVLDKPAVMDALLAWITENCAPGKLPALPEVADPPALVRKRPFPSTA